MLKSQEELVSMEAIDHPDHERLGASPAANGEALHGLMAGRAVLRARPTDGMESKLHIELAALEANSWSWGANMACLLKMKL